MSKGSPVIKLRVTQAYKDKIEEHIRQHNEGPLNSEWTMSDFLAHCIRFYFSETARKADYSKTKRKSRKAT